MDLYLAAASDPEGIATWGQIASVFALSAVGVGAQYRFSTGWGDGGRALRAHGSWGRFLARFGFALLPITVGILAMGFVLLFTRLQIETGLTSFAILGLLAGIAIPGSLVWAYKEYRRPSNWRRRPAWLDEVERVEHPRGGP